MKPVRHRSRLLAIPTCWFTRFSPLFSIKAGVLSQLQMFNSSIECLATDSSPLSSRLLCQLLLKESSRAVSPSTPLFCASFVHFFFDISHLIYSHVIAPREIYRYFRLALIMMPPLYSRSILIMKFVLSLHIDPEICTLAPH